MHGISEALIEAELMPIKKRMCVVSGGTVCRRKQICMGKVSHYALQWVDLKSSTPSDLDPMRTNPFPSDVGVGSDWDLQPFQMHNMRALRVMCIST